MSTPSKCVGIVREVYNKWERRVPLTPSHVQSLVQKGIQVIIQPSTSRIFPDEQYVRAGAKVSEDLTPANVIVGVKQVPVDDLLAEKTYMFFSHTIKAQPENMELLDTILQKKITLIDYECIRESGERNGKRLIAFGGNAGRAGMIAGFRGLGERLINMGYSTPFVNIASAYMYNDLEHAKEAVELAGKRIKNEGLPVDLTPMTFVFTGNGNVSRGAQEIFRLMPHQMVHPNEIDKLPRDPRILYGTVVESEHMVRFKESPERPFSHSEYYQHPDLYEGKFHETIAPYASMIINCMYWDDRFPRLLSREQVAALRYSGNKKLIGIADISCDIGGSMEFLEYSTEIERPFALYDVHDQRMKENLDGDGVMMMSVDILPSELARESSQQFGDKLCEYVTTLARMDSRHFLNENQALPKELIGACIANNGILTPKYEYIHRMRAERERSRNFEYVNEKAKVAGSTCLRLEGHLFDTNLINQVLNLIEAHNGGFYLVDCQVRPNYMDPTSVNMSSAIVQISMGNREELNVIIDKIKTLAEVVPGAGASVTELPDFCGLNYSKTAPGDKSDAIASGDLNTNVTSQEKRKIVCLGAGLVAAPLVEYLSREAEYEINLVSGLEGEADRMYRKLQRQNVKPHTIDVSKDKFNLEKLCASADAVVSLLPAPMHTSIAELCIKNRTPLVTASYISPEMKKLNERAIAAGIPILCELGLDPGMDHMSAMKVINEVKAHDGKVVSFSSVCGGLPAPEAADNPIAYKFSWSPRGVLTAALNSAQYKLNGRIVNIPGEDLMKSNERVNFLPAFAIDQIPNRDSLPYGDIYGIPDAHTIYRGTLRYSGTCDILYQLRQLGLFDTNTSVKSVPSTWPELIAALKQTSGYKLQTDSENFLNWLGVYDESTQLVKGPSLIDTFCTLLQAKLAYQPGERDMVIMHHEFGIEYSNNKKEKRTSTFVGYGSENGDTIMAKTVGVTAAIGVHMILQDAVQGRGVLTPTTPDIYGPALARLEAEGIRFTEKTFNSRN